MQVNAEKVSSGSRQQQTDKGNADRQRVELDRLKFKMNHTMQLLKAEQKQQEGQLCTSHS